MWLKQVFFYTIFFKFSAYCKVFNTSYFALGKAVKTVLWQKPYMFLTWSLQVGLLLSIKIKWNKNKLKYESNEIWINKWLFLFPSLPSDFTKN